MRHARDALSTHVSMGARPFRVCETEDVRSPTLLEIGLGVEVAAKMASREPPPPGGRGDREAWSFPTEPALPTVPGSPQLDVAMPTFGVRVASQGALPSPRRIGTSVCANAGVEAALRCGCRHIDCSEVAGDALAEVEIGNALLSIGETSSLALFVASAPPLSAMDTRRPELLKEACSTTLANLGLRRFGLYILRVARTCPLTGITLILSEDELRALWAMMEALLLEGKTSLIGLSDSPPYLLSSLLSWCKVRPTVHQIEAHPYNQQRAVLDFHRSCRILTECRSACCVSEPSTSTEAGGPKVITQVAAARGVRPQALELAWAAARGSVVLVDLPLDAQSAASPQLAEFTDILCEASRLEVAEAELKAIAELDTSDAGRELLSFCL